MRLCLSPQGQSQPVDSRCRISIYIMMGRVTHIKDQCNNSEVLTCVCYRCDQYFDSAMVNTSLIKLVVVFWNLRKFYSFTKLNRLPLLNLVNWILLLFYDPIRWITWSKHGVLMHTKIEPSCTLRFINNAGTPLQCWKWETCYLLS